MGGGDDRDRPVVQIGQRPGDGACSGSVERGRRFVQHEQLRPWRQGPGQGDPKSLARREPLGLSMREGGHAQAIERGEGQHRHVRSVVAPDGHAERDVLKG